MGLHAEAADGLRVHLDMQEPSGDWADPRGWAHHMWGGSGFKGEDQSMVKEDIRVH